MQPLGRIQGTLKKWERNAINAYAFAWWCLLRQQRDSRSQQLVWRRRAQQMHYVQLSPTIVRRIDHSNHMKLATNPWSMSWPLKIVFFANDSLLMSLITCQWWATCQAGTIYAGKGNSARIIVVDRMTDSIRFLKNLWMALEVWIYDT